MMGYPEKVRRVVRTPNMFIIQINETDKVMVTACELSINGIDVCKLRELIKDKLDDQNIELDLNLN